MGQDVSAWICPDCQIGGEGFSLCRKADGTHAFELLASAYLAGLSGDGLSDETHRAHDCLSDMVKAAPEAAIAFLVVACANCLSVPELSYVAAGPLEDLLEAHGSAVIVKLETIAKVDPKFRLMLSGSWGRDRIDPDVWQRLAAAIAPGPVIAADEATPAAGLASKVLTASERAALFAKVVAS
jgi:hypothetical protein